MISDVPIGAFLSGGIDSSLVVALMTQHVDERVQTFTMGFAGAGQALYDERPLAKEVAERYECRFKEYTVEPHFRAIVGEIVDAFDEPFADDSVIPTYYICQQTRGDVKVAMSGLGGDEMFGGYQRYSGMLLSHYYSRLIPARLHTDLLDPLIQRLPEPSRSGGRMDHVKRFSAAALQSPAERYLSFVSTLGALDRQRLYTPEIVRKIDFDATQRIVTAPFEGCDALDDVSKSLYVDMKTYLPDDILALSDRISMWHSLELRVPFVDHPLVELSGRIPIRYKIDWRDTKKLLRRIAANYVPRKIRNHKKQGFESPMAVWLRTELVDYVRDILDPKRLAKKGIINSSYVASKIDEHLNQRRRNNKLLFSLIMFQEWCERHLP
jgi:asparagine synthase (glutamine-hydrolysing)